MRCGAPAGRPGKGGCSRVSCDKGTQIWFCNDNGYEMIMPCWEIGLAAKELTDNCWWKHLGGLYMTRGQMFTTDDWNVIVTHADC